jgi:hypothetical protein
MKEGQAKRFTSNKQEKMSKISFLCVATTLLLSKFSVNGFVPTQLGRSVTPSRRIMTLQMEDDDASVAATSTSSIEEDELTEKSVRANTANLFSPQSFDEMVRQSASAMTDAYANGVTRQIVRVLLPRDPSGYQLGRYFEGKASLNTRELMLVPPDESWQGGIMQIYRSITPTCQEILRYVAKDERCTVRRSVS